MLQEVRVAPWLAPMDATSSPDGSESVTGRAPLPSRPLFVTTIVKVARPPNARVEGSALWRARSALSSGGGGGGGRRRWVAVEVEAEEAVAEEAVAEAEVAEAVEVAVEVAEARRR